MKVAIGDEEGSVPRMLHELARIFRERNATYDNDYLHIGEVMMGYFPKGLTLTTAEEFNRFALFVHLSGKLGRYAATVTKGGHRDSLDDLSVYSQMLQQHDSRKGAVSGQKGRVDPQEGSRLDAPLPSKRKALAKRRHRHK